MTNFLYVYAAALLGLFAGGLINALSDDLPHTYRVRLPHYPDGTARPLIAWLGTMAFVTGYRVAPQCCSRLSWRHPLTEIVTAGLFAYVAAFHPFSPAVIFFWGNIFILTLITVIDLEHRIILVLVILIGCVFALIGNIVAGAEIAPTVPYRDYIIGGIAGFALFSILYLGGMIFSSVASNARGEEIEEVAFGYGDVLLAMLSGFILGWQALIFAVFIAVFAGGAGALLFLVIRLVVRGNYELFTALPYGQYIVFGTLIMLLWRSNIGNFLVGR